MFIVAVINRILNFFRINPDYESRIFGLDLMRAIAIISVVNAHAVVLEKANTNFPWIKLVDGVELFFVLSGFLIGGILIKLFQKNETFGIKAISKFWIRRWFRTLPNYYLVLILNIIVVYFGIINGDFSQFNWKFFLFLQNFAGPFYGFFWESWSLSIEEWFYLLYPVILSLVYFSLKKLNVSKKYIFLSAIAIFLLIPFLLRAIFASRIDVDSFWLEVRIFKVVIYRLDGIALGLIAAFIKNWYPDFWFRCRNITFISGIILTYTILYTGWVPNAYITKVFKVLFTSLGCFLLLPKFDSIRKAPALLVRLFTHISLISYSMYLLNLALVAEVMNTNFPAQGPYSAWASYVIYWICVDVFSTLLYKFYEKPMMDLRDKMQT